MNIFEQIKERVPIEEVLRDYGVIKKSSKYLCPFHNDKNPSMSIKGGKWQCWSCGAKGSVIDFVMQYEGVKTYEAAKILNERYNLRLMTEKSTQAKTNTNQHNNDIIAKYNADLKEIFDELLYYSRLFNWMQIYSPKCEEEITQLHVISWKEITYLNYVLDELTANKEIFNILELQKYIKRLEAEVFDNSRKSTNDTVYKSAV